MNTVSISQNKMIRSLEDIADLQRVDWHLLFCDACIAGILGLVDLKAHRPWDMFFCRVPVEWVREKIFEQRRIGL